MFKGISKNGFLPNVAKKLHSINHLPRWAVFSIDIGIILFSYLVTYFLMDIWGIHQFGGLNPYITLIVLVSWVAFFIFIFKVSSGVVRHSSIRDIIRISLATFSALLSILIVSKVTYYFIGIKPVYDPPLFFFILITFLLLSLFRFYVKLAFYMFLKFKDEHNEKTVLIFGTDEDSVALANMIEEGVTSGFRLGGFITKHKSKTKSRILGKRLFTINHITEGKFSNQFNGVILSDIDMKLNENQTFIDKLIQSKVKLYHLPIKSIDDINEKNFNQLKSIEIEDLLYRQQIKIENEAINQRHFNKNILITGGAGSIGSELVRKVAKFNPAKIVVIDQAETPLNDIKLEMEASFPSIKFIFHLADISNKHRIEPLFKKYNFSMVYHAAAYKHVPIVEDNPIEAINVNIIGTKIISDLSTKYKINRFVMVSTDKAVNPTNVMGASKRVAELYVQSLQEFNGNTTKFITTRFGNVLGSNGSVIPLFRKQIEEGGPITVTHEKITRYFMTIPEACELVLQAGTMGSGGEIFVFDMGEPVKILDLAKKMIKLSGFEPYKDIQISISGLRPGEKLYEELLSDKTTTLPTPHKKIMRAKDERVNYDIINKKIILLARSSLKKSNLELVAMIKDLVPEYISNNSTYESLDNKKSK